MTEEKKIEEITRENCRVLLAALMEREGVAPKEVAKSIGCGEPTIQRILIANTAPSDNMLKQVGIIAAIGHSKYRTLSDAEKEKILEKMGAVAGGALGFTAITAAVGSSGIIIGLSGAGIASGLAAIGALVGGGMAAGLLTVAAIPIAAGAVGYGMIKGVKALFEGRKVNDERYDPAWEIPIGA